MKMVRLPPAYYSFALGFVATRLDAFILVHDRPRTVRPVRVSGLGWDNDNFLSSLSGSDKDRENANKSYFQMSRVGRPDVPIDNDDYEEEGEDLSRSISGAELTPEMIDKVKQSHTEEEESSGGGKMFREMMNRAKQQEAQAPRQQYYAPQQQQQPPSMPPVDPSNLSVEDQARMFREMMMQQTSGQTAPPAASASPPAKFLHGGVDAMGRRIGRNRDADAIVNSADVYFAQLKRDSSTRNIARDTGDDDKANAVFSDPSIQDIKLHVNPYLEEQKAKEKELLETSPEEMVLPYILDENHVDKPKSYSGVSYKERLIQKRQEKSGSGAPTESQPIQSTAVASAPLVTPPLEETREAVVEPAASRRAEQPIEVEYERVPVEERRQETGSHVPTTGGGSDKDNTRQDIRTLMGLLLKHRGGPGFGAGRLQGNEAKKLETLAGELSDALREEARNFPQESLRDAQEFNVGAPSLAGAAPTITEPASLPPATSAIERAASRPLPSVTGLLTCIEGAIQMFRNSLPELQEGILVNLRAALISAIGACNAMIAVNEQKNLEAFRAATTDPRTRDNRLTRDGDRSPPQPLSVAPNRSPPAEQEGPPSTIPRMERINSMLSCIGGAIQMYKNAPPELQEGVLITLQAALLSGARTCNSLISETGGEAVGVYTTALDGVDATASSTRTAVPTPTATSTQSYDEYYDAVTEEPTSSVSTPSSASSSATILDEANSEFFEEILQKLSAASGSGKMGLREDLSASEAAELSASIAKMRSLLIEELDSASSTSPDPPSPPSSNKNKNNNSAPSSSSSVSSKYEEMLAKAKADKKSKL